MFRKNVAVTAFTFGLTSAVDGTALTGATVTGKISKDGGATATIAGSISEVGNGLYKVDLTQSEMNATIVALAFAASGAVTHFQTIKTVAFDPDDTVRGGLTALPNVASGSAGAIPTTGTGSNQIQLNGSGGVSHVVLCDTCTTNTDMRGTNNAALATNLSSLSILVSTMSTTVSSAASSAADAADQSTAAVDLLEATRWIDNETDEDAWDLVLLKKGTGDLGDGVELLRQPLYDVDGNALHSTLTVIGRSVA